MRKLVLCLCLLQCGLLLSQNQSADPVLFSVDGSEVNVSEFKYIYEKNNADKADYSEQSVTEYLELYKKFKLKVAKARSQGLDTIQSLQKELEGYRKQLAATYLKDKEISEKLVDEVVDRYAEDRQVSHIFVALNDRMTKEQGQAAEEKIQSMHRKLIKNQGEGFELMAKTLSEDKASAKNGGLLGYYTAPLPDGFYNFETAMYSTSEGGYSEPFQSSMGYHIIKVSDIRPARGEMEIAHILIRSKSKGQSIPGARLKVDSLYLQLQRGRNFEDIAKLYSDDKKTNKKGGYLGFFGINQYETSFEDAAFALAEDGSYTMPIETSIGYHIIKRISKRVNSDNKRAKKRIENRISNNDRFKIAEQKLINDVKLEANFSENRNGLIALNRDLDASFYSYKWQPKLYQEVIPLFTLDNKDYTVNDFTSYMKDNVRERLKFPKTKPVVDATNELYEKFMKEKIMDYEEANLERKYPDFKALMREYREGILLFEITKNEVWDKASQDTIGLQKFYSTNSYNYVWPDRVKTEKIEIESNDADKVKSAYEYAQKKGLDKFKKKYQNNVEYKINFSESILEKDALKIKSLEQKTGKVSEMMMAGNKGTFFSFVDKIDSSTKTLKEARGYVIADYQEHLEKEWIENLRKEFPIEINEQILKQLIR